MAIPEDELYQARGDSDARFVDQSHLTYMIPFETDLNLEEAFKDVDPSPSVLDETVDVLLILRTPWADEKTLSANFSRLVISLEAHVVNTGTVGDTESSSPPGQDVIFTGTVQDLDDPFIIVDESDASSDDSDEEQQEQQHVYAIWKMPVFLARPRLRLRRPVAVFHASAALQPVDQTVGEIGYLQSGVPSGLNLLEAFGNDPAVEGIKPRLSALRVSRVAPLTDPKELARSIKALKEIKLDIAPAVHARVRIARPTGQPPNSALTAVLEIDFSGTTPCDITIDGITPHLKGGTVDDLNHLAGVQLLPLTCLPHDHVTFLYSLLPSDLEDIVKNPIRDLDITIKATANLAPSCTPKLSLSWVTPSISPYHFPSAAANRTETTIPDLGITITFSAPVEPIYPGDAFSWTIYIVNRSSDKTPPPPRKLAILALPKRRRDHHPDSGQVADAVLDDNIVHAMHKNSVVEATDVVCLSSDVRVGPLAAGTCHVAELKFMALREGVLGVEAVRVVDLGSQEHVIAPSKANAAPMLEMQT
ncbi:unnamed protein product [Parascedosporium putredinis]|uniref:Trafficking protein particle complex II-specific subunit 65 IgD3 domain-containing protein n=1 Tax=Parascedosporium putredinis TaxID=1442378 RepID=A0A9P1MAY8_9PEZI|nr:unnamed protein product [Parascedosporium putredinis]CAI7997705.1 unnamed protein product [Parascedosporium putredinis]